MVQKVKYWLKSSEKKSDDIFLIINPLKHLQNKILCRYCTFLTARLILEVLRVTLLWRRRRQRSWNTLESLDIIRILVVPDKNDVSRNVTGS